MSGPLHETVVPRSVFPMFVVFFIQLNLYEGAKLWLGEKEPYISTPVQR